MVNIKFFLLIMFVVFAGAQTRVRPEQIKNIQQVRIYWRGDGMDATTHVSVGLKGQLSDGRFVMTPEQWATSGFPDYEKNDPINPILPICVVDWIGIGPIGELAGLASSWNEQRNIRTISCYRQLGLDQLKQDPSWAAFLAPYGY
jgi:hypothetical protein